VCVCVCGLLIFLYVIMSIKHIGVAGYKCSRKNRYYNYCSYSSGFGLKVTPEPEFVSVVAAIVVVAVLFGLGLG